MLASWARYWRGNMAALPLRSRILRVAHQPPFLRREPDLWNYFMQRSGAQPWLPWRSAR